MKRYVIGNRKVAVIGTGYVGASIAYALAIRDIAREIVLIDRSPEKAEAEAKDIRHGIAGMGQTDIFVGDYSDCADCDMIIIAAGRNRKDNEKRLELSADNIAILRTVITSVKKYYTRGVILIVANPVDVLTFWASKWMGLPSGMVFGSGCLLDTSRFICAIADYTGTDPGAINAYMVGEHGDGQVPVWSRVTVGGIPISEYCGKKSLPWDQEIRGQIEKKVRDMGTQIILGKGRTHYGIATCASYLAEAILDQRPTMVPVSSVLEGEYGVSGVSLSVPSIVGSSGVQRRIQEPWAEEEYRAFLRAANQMKALSLSLTDA